MRAAERLFALEAGQLGAASVLQRRIVVVGEVALLHHPAIVAAFEDHDVEARELELVDQTLRLDQVLVRRDGAEVDPRRLRRVALQQLLRGVVERRAVRQEERDVDVAVETVENRPGLLR